MARSYANLGFAAQSGLDLDSLDLATRTRLSRARTVRGARGAIAGFLAAFEDPHLHLVSRPPAFVRYLSNQGTESETRPIPGTTPAGALCDALGYEDGIGGGYSLPFEDLPGFQPAQIVENTFNAAAVPALNDRRVGIVRISLFSPHKSRSHCMKAWSERQRNTSASCASSCQDSVYYRAGALLAQTLRESIAALEREGVSSILVDIGGNGGGSEWVGLAVRAVTSAPLTLPRTLVTTTSPRKECSWEEVTARRCSNLRPIDPDSETVAIFSERNAAGSDLPIFVLVDARTASASEYFAAVLGDNGAARIIGTRTMGAGCGYVNGGGQYTLPRTGLRLRAPNCVRLRKNGSNERSGVRPDIEISPESSPADRARMALDSAAAHSPR